MTSHPRKERLKVVHVVHSLNLGGAEKLVVRMSQALAGQFDISVLCLDEPGLWAEKLRKEGFSVHCLWRQPGMDMGVVIKLAKFTRENRVDIVHAHQSTPWFYAGLSRLLHGSPRLLFEEHGRHYPEVGKEKKILFNRYIVLPLTHRVVAVSEDTKNRLVRYEGLVYDRIDVIYNGVAAVPSITPQERTRLRRELGLSPNDFVVGTVGRFDPIKNLSLLVESIAIVREKIPAIKGLLVGDGPTFEKIKELRKSRKLSNALVMPGYCSNAGRLVQCMDLFVLSSVSEGVSVALLEAMAAGVPVVVTNVGGNPEIVSNGKTGWIIASGSLTELTAAILDAAEHPQRIQQFAEMGRRQYEERFQFEAMIERYGEIYHSLIQ